MISAIILAAGDSARMGQPKALLSWRGQPFIEHVCRALRAAGVTDRTVVLGRAAAEVLAGWAPQGEKILVNPRPEDGQLSSLRAGLGAADPQAGAFLVCLADQPTIGAETYRAVMDCWRGNTGAVVIPRVLRASDSRMKRGHPIIIPAVFRPLCFEGPLDKGLHWVTHHPSVKVLDLDVKDAEIIRDFDTPEDYAALAGAGNGERDEAA